MAWGDVLGYSLCAFLLGGLGWALVDLFARIRRQPKRPLDMLRMTSYPFVPDDEILQAALEPESTPVPRGLRLSPVMVERQRQLRRKLR
jgi:hypothetical protein